MVILGLPLALHHRYAKVWIDGLEQGGIVGSRGVALGLPPVRLGYKGGTEALGRLHPIYIGAIDGRTPTPLPFACVANLLKATQVNFHSLPLFELFY